MLICLPLCPNWKYNFYESDNSHFAIAIYVGEFDRLTSISVYLRIGLTQGYITSCMKFPISIFLKNSI